MPVRFFDEQGLKKFDTKEAELLLSTRWQGGRDQSRWLEVYRTPKGNLVALQRTLWAGERDHAFLASKSQVAHWLALAEPQQRTEEGEKFLAEHDLCQEV